MFEAPSLALALAGSALALLFAVLAGLWIGFRIALRDAALLASTAREAAAAIDGAKAAHARCDALEETWALQVQRVERMRASATAAAARAKAANEEPPAPPPEPVPQDINERRRQVARRAMGAGR